MTKISIKNKSEKLKFEVDNILENSCVPSGSLGVLIKTIFSDLDRPAL